LCANAASDTPAITGGYYTMRFRRDHGPADRLTGGSAPRTPGKEAEGSPAAPQVVRPCRRRNAAGRPHNLMGVQRDESLAGGLGAEPPTPQRGWRGGV